MDEPVTSAAGRGAARRRAGPPLVVCTCLLVAGVWMALAHWSQRPFQGFELTAADFAAFRFRDPDWSLRQTVPVMADPAEPNILAFRLQGPGGRVVTARLAHGYNMCECMRLRGYTVTLLSADLGGSGRQVWRLTSQTGHIAIWVTSLLRANGFGPSGVDVRALAFPRVGVPDEPGWSPQGVTAAGLRHPVAGLHAFLRSRWNASRCDWLTFLGLRQPAWASGELLTLVTASDGLSLTPENEVGVAGIVVDAHAHMQRALQAYRAAAPMPAAPP